VQSWFQGFRTQFHNQLKPIHSYVIAGRLSPHSCFYPCLRFPRPPLHQKQDSCGHAVRQIRSLTHLKMKSANTDQETSVSTQISQLLYYHAVVSPMQRRKRLETLLSAAARSWISLSQLWNLTLGQHQAIH